MDDKITKQEVVRGKMHHGTLCPAAGLFAGFRRSIRRRTSTANASSIRRAWSISRTAKSWTTIRFPVHGQSLEEVREHFRSQLPGRRVRTAVQVQAQSAERDTALAAFRGCVAVQGDIQFPYPSAHVPGLFVPADRFQVLGPALSWIVMAAPSVLPFLHGWFHD